MENNITLENIKDYLLYETISGSKAYGLDLPTSDTDIRGIFLQPNDNLLGLGYKEQVNDIKNDIVYYELNRFMYLLSQGNPNILELLFTEEKQHLFFDKRLNILFENRNLFLTKKLKNTFGGYAVSQIKKARGLNKKIVNKVAKEKKTPLDFCYILTPLGASPLREWLRMQRTGLVTQNNYGVSKINHVRDMFYIYPDTSGKIGYRGILKDDTSNELRMSSIPKAEIMKAHSMYYNQDGYSKYCVAYKEYWNWVDKRNPIRYRNNVDNKHNYDGKNLMHCIRLLDMATEIAQGKGVNLVRPDRDFLLSIRAGKLPYEEIVAQAEEKMKIMDLAFEKSSLNDGVDSQIVHDIILQIRK